MRELVYGKSNPTATMWGDSRAPTSFGERAHLECLCLARSVLANENSINQLMSKKLGSFLFLYIVVRLCKQAFNTIYYVQKRVETGISTLLAHHSFSRTFRLRKVRDSNPRYNAMCTPHFECGSFDHSDNFPHLRVQRYNNFLN